MPTLFDPVTLGAIDAPNRILMPALTRGRATREAVPTEMMAEYYAQRASAGLIISEGTGVSREGLGWIYAPGIWSTPQVEGWKRVTAAVHDRGGRIVAQLWHMGRRAHSSVTGCRSVSASATTSPGTSRTYDGVEPFGPARALEHAEIGRVVDDYVQAARNAMTAGFDGIQLHAANGYLIDQFLREGTNRREDEYGGDPEGRVRFLGEVTEAVAVEIGADRTGVRLSPNAQIPGSDDNDPAAVYVEAARVLSELRIAFLELREPKPDGTFDRSDIPPLSPRLRQVFDGPLVLNQDYTRDSGTIELESGCADAIAFGRMFIANPDLPERLRRNAPMNIDRPESFYTRDVEGYLDYPTLATSRSGPSMPDSTQTQHTDRSSTRG